MEILPEKLVSNLLEEAMKLFNFPPNVKLQNLELYNETNEKIDINTPIYNLTPNQKCLVKVNLQTENRREDENSSNEVIIT